MPQKSLSSCQVCSATVTELRRGRCWGCYSSWVAHRPVGLGALCCLCGDRRREHLKSIELLGSWMPVCHNCSSMTTALHPMPQSIGEIREALRRDRRGDDRRWGKRDTRIFRYNRRGLDRRLPREFSDAVDDDMIVEISELVSELELLSLEANESTRGDLTCIQERPQSGESQS